MGDGPKIVSEPNQGGKSAEADRKSGQRSTCRKKSLEPFTSREANAPGRAKVKTR